jgi:hypothetical protein
VTDLETEYIGRFNFKDLYNFKRIATSMSGYKHTEQALKKMLERFKNKKNHPFSVKLIQKKQKNSLVNQEKQMFVI